MDYTFKGTEVLVVLAVTVLYQHCVDGQSRCGEPAGILNGHSVVLRRGKLAQYFCDRNYFLHGQAMVSCVDGRWSETPPICITFTCERLIHPLHSDRQESLRGSLVTYTCRDGFILVGASEIYCDGQRWSSSPPECREDLEAISLVPATPESIPVDPPIIPQRVSGNTSAASSPEISVGSGDAFRPRFLSRSERPPPSTNYAKMAKNGVLSLYKPADADSEDREPADTESTPREQQRPPVQVNNIPNPVMERPISPRILQPSFPRYTGYTGAQNMPFDRRFGWQYNRRALPFYPPYVPQYIRRPMYPNPPVAPPMYQQGQYGDRITSDPRPIASQRNIPVVGTSSPYKISPQDERWNAASKPTESQNTRTSLQPTPPAKIKIPPLTTERQETITSGGNGACSVPIQPDGGYYQIRTLPRDYEGDAMYLAEYHCQKGLTLVGGDNLSYCMKTGRWKGRLPRCEKNVKCDPGYVKEGDACVDLNECTENNGGCAQTCLNFKGGHKCSCLPGYRKHQMNDCADIDECEDDRCQHICRNIPGSFQCSCNPGYVVSKTDFTKCIDVNECATPGRRLCDHLCQNMIGSFRCACKPNFRLGEDGRSCFEVCMPGYAMQIGDLSHTRECVDEDECAEHHGLGNCEHICNNTAGSYFCSCNHGYKLNQDGQSCSDINECEDSSTCTNECENTAGSYRCSCLPNQAQAADGSSCLGCIKDFYMDRGRCNACPENSVTESIGATAVGHCDCRPGYEGSPLLQLPCSDVNECNDDNYGCSHLCVNTPGSVYCTCPDGYQLDIDGRTCVDEDECLSRSGVCGDGHQCRNIQGGYTCVCMRGFQNSRINPRKCVDIDECSIRNGGCQSRCHNMQPGHRCSCYAGKTLAPDGRTCTRNGNTCAPLHIISNGRVLPTSVCSDVPNVTIGQVCFYACNGGYKIRGIYRTRCSEKGWTSSPPKCVGTGITCPPLPSVPYGKVVPATSCSGSSNVSMGRTCFFVCREGYTLHGVRRVTCGESGWSSTPPNCVASDFCPPLTVPAGVRVFPPTCAVSNVLPSARCLFWCENPSDILDGRRTSTCFSGSRWQYKPPVCIPRLSSINRNSGVPWINCPPNMSVTLPPGRSRIFVKGLRPVTNMNATVQIRSDRLQSLTIFPAGKTTVKFIARSSNGLQNASCETVIMVQDREAPIVISCPGTIDIMTPNRYPGRVWKRPLFRDNVGVAKVKQTITPQGRITWGKYRVSYVATDYSGNTAQCSFSVIIKRSMPRNRVSVICGTPSGPANGSANCEAWAHGVYCDPTCKRGYAFSQNPSTYMCGDDGVWSPNDAIPDCTEVRPAHMRMRESQTTPAATEVTERGNVVETTPRYQLTTIQESTSTGQRTSPVLRILKRPNFHPIALVGDSERTRLRPTVIQTQNVVPTETPQRHTSLRPRNSTHCPPGQIPKVSASGRKLCVECPKGYYRPRINIATLCRPCSPGFYQEKSGQSYCSRCPNVPKRYLPDLRHRFQLRGFSAIEQCTQVDAYVNDDSVARSDGVQRSLFRSRYRRFRPQYP